ncbi:MAG: hypothetical protein JO294_01115 [Alphaproteobacteria bacterium]|nr:hypothetical protein [Alphaproteobacteria bacterium]
MHHFSGVYGIDFFWLFIMAVVLGGIISGILKNNEREKTIRAAIEKGITLDPGTLSSLRAGATNNAESARAGLFTGSIITFFVGVGLMAMAFFIGVPEEGHPIFPLIGVGVLLWCISAGLFVARYAHRTDNK